MLLSFIEERGLDLDGVSFLLLDLDREENLASRLGFFKIDRLFVVFFDE